MTSHGELPVMAGTAITVSCGTRFHSDYLAHHLWKRNRLKSSITGHSFQRFTNRVGLPRHLVRNTFPYFYASQVCSRVSGGKLSRFDSWLDERAIAAFDRSAAQYCQEVLALVCWSRSSLRQMQSVCENGGISLIERVGSDTMFQHRILSEECQNLGLKDPPHPSSFILEREEAEYDMADVVLCPSEHVRDSLHTNPASSNCKLVLNHYGVNATRFSPAQQHTASDSTQFQVLFVGTIGVRKGCIYFLEAAKRFKSHSQVRFTLVGPVEHAFKPILKQYLSYVDFLGPQPNLKLADIYRGSSVFLFPSLDEGMAYVQREAQACGLPLISTKNAGGDQLIEHGVNGFLVPIRDVESIVSAIETLVENPGLLASMRRATISDSRAHNWAEHASGVIQCVDQFLSGGSS